MICWQIELDADPKAIQQIEFVGQLRSIDGINADGAESTFVLTTLEKIKETWLKFSRKCNSISKRWQIMKSKS